MIDKLCNEYKIGWRFMIIRGRRTIGTRRPWLRVIKDRSHRVGACADTGHWKRSGFDPVECMKKLEGRILTFHFKDVKKEGNGYHDVPWGTRRLQRPRHDGGGLAATIPRESSPSSTSTIGKTRSPNWPRASSISTRWPPRSAAGPFRPADGGGDGPERRAERGQLATRLN